MSDDLFQKNLEVTKAIGGSRKAGQKDLIPSSRGFLLKILD
jgi:hypothetical protein